MRKTKPFFWLALAWVLTGQAIHAQTPARQAGYLYLSPVPNASYVSAQTRYVLVRFEQITPSDITNLSTGFVTVTGASSGRHSGTARVASDAKTVIFEMGADFINNELVTVSLNPQVEPWAAGLVEPFQYQFEVTAPMPGFLPLGPLPAQVPISPDPPVVTAPKVLPSGSSKTGRSRAVPKAVVMANGVSVPNDFPQVVITVNSNPSPGYLWMETGADNGAAAYTVIMDNNGLPVWYRRGRMECFTTQPNGSITWCVGDDTGYIACDQNFNYLKTYLTTNGYSTDSHDLKVLADGSYFMIGYRNNTVDMSQYVQGGGLSTVRETVVQGFTPEGDLVFQWRAWDNYDLRDEGGNTDFPHMNAVNIDEDGNVLVSARHLSEVTKIDRNSGDIIWRLSGAHSTFSFVNDPFNGTSLQHHITAQGNGRYMVFDNGNYHSPQVSRAVEYQLDLTNKTATVVFQFRDNPDKYTYWLGSSQRLPSGNTLINFVRPQYPKAIEVDSNGAKHFEISFVPGADSYRAFRLPWNGVVAAPYLILEPQSDSIALVFNKFGDSDVAYYRIYGGTSPQPTTVLAESETTLKNLSNLQNGLYYFRVTAVSTDGTESPFSNEESVNVNITPPGQNLVLNGDFSQRFSNWGFRLSGTAIATVDTPNQTAAIYITNGGTALSNVQLTQGARSLVQGREYVLEFDAWASQPRYIQVQLAQSLAPYTDYSRITPPYLTPNATHYRYTFTMQQPTDFSVNLLFNLGTESGNVFLDNVRLFNPPVGDVNQDGRVNYQDLETLVGNWLKQDSDLPGDLNGDGRVDFDDFGVLGESWGSGAP